jgi:hypothetical protein
MVQQVYGEVLVQVSDFKMGGITDSQISGYPENLRTDPNVEKMRL